MQKPVETVRAPRPQSVLWKWTGVSAVLHAILVGALCGVSYLGFTQREAKAKAKAEAQEAAAQKAEAAAEAKTPPPPAAAGNATSAPAGSTATATAAPAAPPVTSGVTPDKIATAPASPEIAPAAPTQQAQAEKILGIDKVAKPDETPKSPFAGKDDDLLKDLK